ncbi:MAG: dihydrolipoyl dehydrogenase family protein [Janthinobacterium lividum]
MSHEVYDAVVLGSGEGGKFMAWHLARQGERVAVVEDRYIGGSCPNIACLPSKNIIHSAAIAETVRTSALFGTRAGEVAVSMAEVQARKRAMVEGLIAMHLDRYRASEAELVLGRGIFVGERTIEVALNDGGQRTIEGRKLFLDLGAFASVPDLPGLKEAEPLTHVGLLDLETLPEHLLILGGGYIALELAQAMRRLGSRVTVCERAERLLMREDPDIAAEVTDLLQAEGIAIVTGVGIDRVSGRSGDAVTLHGRVAGVEQTIQGSHLLVALGKAPNTRGIGLEKAGVTLTAAGYVQVNDRLETSAANVWALGDCAGTPAFTHMSFEDFRLVRDNLAGRARSTAGRQVPNCLFIEPELARVGLNESEARQQGIPYRVAELPIRAILRTRTTGETRGKLKALIGSDDCILGFMAFGPRAGEFLPVVQLAMAQGLPYQALESLTIAHPTYSEGLVLLFGTVPAA